jgi:hypothetical protein
MKTRFWTALLTLTLLSALDPRFSAVFAQGTAFTYQGRLNDGGTPVKGTCDFTFSLFDVASGSMATAGPVSVSGLAVSNGLFTATVDFGPGIFNGASYWLEIGVRTNVGSSYTTLAPRQELAPTPYAIYSESANGVVSNSLTGSDIQSGQVVKSLNGLQDAVTLAAGTNVTITPGGNTLTISSAGAGGSGVWSVTNNNAYYTAGKVGIGTATPAAGLQVASGGVAVTGANSPYTGAGAGVFMEYGRAGAALFAFDYTAYQPLSLILNSPGGNVGIGTTTPQAKVHIYDPANSVTDLIETGGGVNSWARVFFKDTDGQWDIGTSPYFNNDQLYFYREGASVNAFAIQPNGDASIQGRLGLGTAPVENLTIAGVASYNTGMRLTGNTTGGTGMALENTSSGGHKYDLISTGVADAPGAGAFGIFDETAGAYRLTISPSGTVTVPVLTITGGADVAEPFPLSGDSIAEGSVVVIDEEHPGQLKLSSKAYDTRVAGIVSGANGIHPGLALHQNGKLGGGKDVALSGRVYVLADADYGAIRPGDLLTTSDRPGYAMKVKDHARAAGAILGKAMTGLNSGKGMVLVLVTLQ